MALSEMIRLEETDSFTSQNLALEEDWAISSRMDTTSVQQMEVHFPREAIMKPESEMLLLLGKKPGRLM